MQIAPQARVLVVDDSFDVRDSLRRALGYAGYAVAVAANGGEALQAVAQAPVDLIILDVLMPMLDGLDTCRALRSRGDATPVLVLTARDISGAEREQLAEADRVLPKGDTSMRDLTAEIRRLESRPDAR